MTHPPAVLLGGGPTAVPVARSVARLGAKVHSLEFGFEPVRYSRACSQHVSFGGADGIELRWLDWLNGANAKDAVILPCCDEGLDLVARHRALLVERGYRPMEANDDVLLAMLDKLSTFELAMRAGVRVPRTELARDLSRGLAGAEEIGFPLGLKPRLAHRSGFARRKDRLRQKLIVVHDREALAAQLPAVLASGCDVLLTEIVPGPDDAHHSYYSYVDEQGVPLFGLTKHKLRQYPPGFGWATYHVIDRNEEVMELGSRFLEAIGLRGLACVEFKRDERDGRLTLIECNHRFTAGTELVQHAGIDMAALSYSRVAGLPPPTLNGYRTGLRMWHPVEDLLTFGALRRRREITLADWLRSLLHRQHFPLFRWSDPLPSIASVIRVASVLPRVWFDTARGSLSGLRDRHRP